MPEGILNHGGPNHVALTLRSESSELRVLCSLTKEASMPTLSGRRRMASAFPYNGQSRWKLTRSENGWSSVIEDLISICFAVILRVA